MDDSHMIKDLQERLARAEETIGDVQNQVAYLVRKTEDLDATKVDKSELQELEKLIMDRLNDIVNALGKQFADKAETKKALKLLEKQLKNLYELIMSKQGGQSTED